MTRGEESARVAQHHLADAQSALRTVEGGVDENRRRLGVEEQQRGDLESLLCGLLSCLVDDSSFVD